MTDSNKASMKKWVNGGDFDPAGGTNFREGLEKAFEVLRYESGKRQTVRQYILAFRQCKSNTT